MATRRIAKLSDIGPDLDIRALPPAVVDKRT
jgi:hypothetical protein